MSNVIPPETNIHKAFWSAKEAYAYSMSSASFDALITWCFKGIRKAALNGQQEVTLNCSQHCHNFAARILPSTYAKTVALLELFLKNRGYKAFVTFHDPTARNKEPVSLHITFAD